MTTATSTPTSTQGPSRTTGRDTRWSALVVIAVAQLMVALDATIVNIALPSAQQDLGFGDADRTWVVTAYTCTLAGLLLLGGRVADRFGRRRAFLVGLAGFAAASALAGFAPNLGTLVAGRALQGGFAAILTPTALSLVATTFTDPRERARAFGVYGAVASSGAAVGLLLGGVLTEYAGWRWCLFVNVAVAVGASVAGRAVLPRDRGYPEARLDTVSGALVTTGLVAIVLGCARAATEGWASWQVLVPAAARRRAGGGVPGPADPDHPAAAAAVGAHRPVPCRCLPCGGRVRGRIVRDVPHADLPLPGRARLHSGAGGARLPAPVRRGLRERLRPRQPAAPPRRAPDADRARTACSPRSASGCSRA